MIEKKFEKEKDGLRAAMRKHPGVVGIGFGYKKVGKSYTDQPSITVFVKKKLPKGDLGSKAIPSTLKLADGTEVATDVIETGEIKFTGFTGRTRPAAPGAVIGWVNGPFSGTFGAVVTDNTDGKNVVLSCNHVLANFNEAPIGSAILQPSTQFGGKDPGDRIGTLKRFVPINLNQLGENYVDAAILAPSAANLIKANPLCSVINIKKQSPIGMVFAASPFITIINPMNLVLAEMNCSLAKVKNATVGMSVHTCSAISGYVTTNITHVMVDLILTADNGNDVWFLDQTLAAGGILDGAGGDSGAVFYTTFST